MYMPIQRERRRCERIKLDIIDVNFRQKYHTIGRVKFIIQKFSRNEKTHYFAFLNKQTIRNLEIFSCSSPYNVFSCWIIHVLAEKGHTHENIVFGTLYVFI